MFQDLMWRRLQDQSACRQTAEFAQNNENFWSRLLKQSEILRMLGSIADCELDELDMGSDSIMEKSIRSGVMGSCVKYTENHKSLQVHK